jgi:ParB family transcriptional regulator, chromosome partitioning protein
MLKEVEYKELVENNYNPRKRFDDAEMVQLTESIRKVGLLEPLVVRKKNGKYEVVCGVRRYKALGNLNNGKKVPVNIVDVDDHHALILSFTENFERANFTPMEEARFFAKALGTTGSIGPIPNHGTKEVIALSKEIPSSPATIERRLSLLALPQEVQTMVENDELLLGVAEIISRLRSIADKEIRKKRMLRLAQDFSGKEPNIGKLKQEVESIKETYEIQKNKEEKQIKEYQKEFNQKKRILETNLNDTVEWYNDTFDTKLEANIDHASEILSILQDKGHDLTTDKNFEHLSQKQITLENSRDRLLSNLKIVKKENLETCPFCGGFARASIINSTINKLQEEIDTIQREKRSLSKMASDVESYREDLRKSLIEYQNAEDALKKIGGSETDE